MAWRRLQLTRPPEMKQQHQLKRAVAKASLPPWLPMPPRPSRRRPVTPMDPRTCWIPIWQPLGTKEHPDPVTAKLADSLGYQSVGLSTNALATTELTLTIVSVYPGDNWEDAAISGLKIYGYPEGQ